jgi:hypothetical protein
VGIPADAAATYGEVIDLDAEAVGWVTVNLISAMRQWCPA